MNDVSKHVKEQAGLLEIQKPRLSFVSEQGSVLFYILLAVVLMAALSYAFTKDTRSNTTVLVANQSAQELYAQANTIRSAVMQCILEYPGGGGDLDGDNDIDTSDNANTPYPLEPNDALNPLGAAGDDQARHLSCLHSDTEAQYIFEGANSQGRLLPPPPTGYSEWEYFNDADGVYIQTTGVNTATNLDGLNRLMTKFATCQADLNYGACGATCLTVWIDRVAACP